MPSTYLTWICISPSSAQTRAIVMPFQIMGSEPNLLYKVTVKDKSSETVGVWTWSSKERVRRELFLHTVSRMGSLSHFSFSYFCALTTLFWAPERCKLQPTRTSYSNSGQIEIKLQIPLVTRTWRTLSPEWTLIVSPSFSFSYTYREEPIK